MIAKSEQADISHAIILAAGHGKRMQPLTNTTPKPLLKVAGKALIEYHIEALARGGINYIVINTGRLGDQFEPYLGDGSRFGVSIVYSHEGDSPLETGGGICKALPLLKGDYFIAVNGDVWTNFDFSLLRKTHNNYGHLILVTNPSHNPQGDFAFEQGKIKNTGENRYTFSGIAAYHRELFSTIAEQAFSLAPLLRDAISREKISAELFSDQWYDIGTPERLATLEAMLSFNVATDLE